eukprot:TRINITY_DN3527_c0_g4_i1.p1 TRINITY_DN3527_c0_g4~~TRINITY_DN3527_c0_g4_i1.p1  ORF type:complete len:158 (-),score=12.85 TRINITY_DN3527_c0_g4_i1:78-551(-)
MHCMGLVTVNMGVGVIVNTAVNVNMGVGVTEEGVGVDEVGAAKPPALIIPLSQLQARIEGRNSCFVHIFIPRFYLVFFFGFSQLVSFCAVDFDLIQVLDLCLVEIGVIETENKSQIFLQRRRSFLTRKGKNGLEQKQVFRVHVCVVRFSWFDCWFYK